MRKALIVLATSLVFYAMFSACGKKEKKVDAVKTEKKLEKTEEAVQKDIEAKKPNQEDKKFEEFIKGVEKQVLEPAEELEPKKPVRPIRPVRQAKKFPAEPLPNGVVFDDNLSVAIARMERKDNNVKIWLAFRKVAEDSNTRLTRHFELKILDDRENTYGSRENVWRIPKGLPNGFTWISFPVEIKMPKIAPIANIEIEKVDWGTLLFRQKLNIDFRNPNFPSFDFQPKPEEVISPGKEIKVDKNLSMRLEQISSKRETRSGVPCIKYIIPFTLKNNDYNPRSPLLAEYIFYTLYNNGRLSGGESLTLYTDGTWSDGQWTQLNPKSPIPALGTKIYTFYVWVKIREQEKTSVRMFLMCFEGFGVYYFKYLIPISSGD